MSAFEFLTVLLSIIFGLGLTNLLSGLSRAIQRRRDNPPDGLHLIWSLNVFLVLFLNWWVAFSWKTTATWSFEIDLRDLDFVVGFDVHAGGHSLSLRFIAL